MSTLLDDCFYDCQSDSEIEDDNNGDHILRAVGGYSSNRELLSSVDDPMDIRSTLERVTKASRLLLRCFGGKCESLDSKELNASRTFFYPATLEICARLVTDKSCPVPPSAQCRLRGDPVSLQLPMELNPYNGQVNVNVFQPGPKPLPSQYVGAGDRRFGPMAARSDVEAGMEAGQGQGQGQGQGFGISQRAAMFQGPGVVRRHTQRHNSSQKSGRRVRWPDIL